MPEGLRLELWRYRPHFGRVTNTPNQTIRQFVMWPLLALALAGLQPGFTISVSTFARTGRVMGPNLAPFQVPPHGARVVAICDFDADDPVSLFPLRLFFAESSTANGSAPAPA